MTPSKAWGYICFIPYAVFCFPSDTQRVERVTEKMIRQELELYDVNSPVLEQHISRSIGKPLPRIESHLPWNKDHANTNSTRKHRNPLRSVGGKVFFLGCVGHLRCRKNCIPMRCDYWQVYRFLNECSPLIIFCGFLCFRMAFWSSQYSSQQ